MGQYKRLHVIVPLTTHSCYERDYIKCICNSSVQEIKRTGILKRIEEKTWPPQYTEVLKEPPSGVTLATATILSVVLLSGVITSVLLLVIESGLRELGQLCH